MFLNPHQSKSFIAVLFIFFVFPVFSQPISGTKTVCTSGCDYGSLNAAFTALNTNGVAAGGATIEIASGHTETLPNAGISLGSVTLNATLNANNPLVIRKSFLPGNNPQFTSGSGVGGIDAMVKLLGVDYVTFDGLDFIEANTNISSFTQYEYGIMLVKRNAAAPVDGCQYNTIRNCNIRFRRNTFMTQAGIYAANHTATNTSNITYTSVNDAHSFNSIENNTITNAQFGVYFSGINITSASTTLYDQSNKIGSSNQGNTIVGFGPNNSSVASGIAMYYQNNLEVEGNTISGGGLSFTNTLNGIDLKYIARAFVKNNTITDTVSSGTNNGLLINNSNTGRLYVESNFIRNCRTATGTFNGINAIACDTLIINQNHINSNTYWGTASQLFAGLFITLASNRYVLMQKNEIYGNRSTTSFYGINILGSSGITRIYENKIYRDTCVNGANLGIINNHNSSLADSVVGNEIYDLINTVNGSVIGYLKPVTGYVFSGNKVIEANKFYNFRTKLGLVKAIEYNNTNAQVNILRNQIYGFRSDSINTTLTGIEIGPNHISAVIANNLIYDFETYTSSIESSIYGVFINTHGPTNISRIYYNTIYFNAPNSGNLLSYCVRASVFSQVELRNNVLVNKSLAVPFGMNAAYYRESSNLDTYRLGSNQNLFFSSGSPGRFAAYYDGANRDTTLTQIRQRLAPRESESYFEDVQFQQSTITPYDLKPAAGVPSQIESGANYIDTPFVVLNDLNGNPRALRYPDLGCYEGFFLPADFQKPQVSYGQVSGVSPFQPAPQITVVASDRFGIKGSVTNRPRLYYKKKSASNSFINNTNQSTGWKFVQTNNSVSPFTFQIDYNLLQGGITIGDTIEFFAAVEDSNGTVGCGDVLTNGVATSTSLIASNFPVSGSIPFFPVYDTLSGVFTVGNGGAFSSITAALNRYAASVQTGPVAFVLTNNMYTTPALGGQETFPISLRPAVGMSATNTLLIRPAAGLNPLIIGSFDSALFIVRDGVNNFTLEGSNNNTTSRNLRITNTHVNAQSVLFVQSTNQNGGIKNVEIRNVILKGSNVSTTQIIIIGGRTGIGAQAITKSEGADRITIRNCNLYVGVAGIMALGSASSPITNLLIDNNRFSSDSSNLVLGTTGVYLEGANNAVLNKNQIVNIYSGTGVILSGVHLGENVNNTCIKNNIIHSVESGNANSTGCYGVFVSSGVGVNNDSIYNNSISRILASNSSSSIGSMFNSFGIKINGGTNLKIYYNTVHFSGGSFFGSGVSGSSAFQIFGNGPFTGLDIQNNVFSNIRPNGLGGSRHTAFWASTTLPIVGATINNNNYYVDPANGFLLYDGFSNYNDLASVRTTLGGNLNSVSTNPRLISNSDLRPIKGATTKEGVVLSGINRDLVDSIRTAPSTRLGCYETDYDIFPPQFGVHQNAVNSGSTPLRTLPALIISDTLSGISMANGRKPRVYFKKKSEGNGFGPNQSSFNGWKFVETSSAASPFEFTLKYALLTSLPLIGDSIYYFFAAADSLGNYAALPSAGFSSITWDSFSTPPSTPFRFAIVGPPMSGVYRVGAGGNYTTLSSAVNDVNQRGVSGPVTFLLIQSTYTTPAETFPIAFSSQIQGVSAVNTIQIRPANGVTATIIGSASPSNIYFNGSRHISINGADTTTQAGRRITIRNTSSDPAVLFANDASFNGIQNCFVYGNTTFNNDGIVEFGNRISTGNNNNIIDSCYIGALNTSNIPATCISASGSTGPANVLSTGNVITNNEIVSPRNCGIFVDNTNANLTITGNSFYKNLTYSHSSNFSFISYASAGFANISNNFFGGSAAYCGGTQNTAFDGTVTYQLLQLSTANAGVAVRNNTFRRISFATMLNNGNHAFIAVLNGKAELTGNTIGADTGVASIQFNYVNNIGVAAFSGINIGASLGTALDSVLINQNKIGAIQVSGGGLLSFYGIRFSASSGVFSVTNNIIGSNQTAASINQLCNGDLCGIEFTVNNGQHVTIENNTIRNLRYSLHQSKTLYGIFISGNAPAIIRNNRITQLSHNPSNPALISTSFTFINGIFLSASGSGERLVANNTVSQINTIGTPSGNAAGIQVSGSSTNFIEVARNSILGIGPINNTEARAIGISTFGPGILVHNNEIALGTDSLSNANTGSIAYIGIQKSGAANKIFYNTVRISGQNVSTSGTNNSTAFYSEIGDAQDSVFNNIFINERSNTSASGGKHYAAYFWLGSNPIMNYNLLYANGTNAILGNANAIDYATLSTFSSATATNFQSQSKAVAFQSAWRLRLAGVSLGDTLLAGIRLANIQTDIDNHTRPFIKPYMGCDEAISNPLPVKLISFDVKLREDDAEISWVTAQEINNKGFVIEKSLDGINFTPLTFIKANGNSYSTKQYSYDDKGATLQHQLVYYRLIQEDLNGEQDDLGVRVVQKSHSLFVRIYPNPAEDYLLIETGKEAIVDEICLFDLQGKLLKKWHSNSWFDESEIKLNINDFDRGMYLLKTKVNGKMVLNKIVLQ